MRCRRPWSWSAELIGRSLAAAGVRPRGSSTSPEFRESLVRAQFDALGAVLPPTFHVFAAAGLSPDAGATAIDHVFSMLAPLLLKAERHGAHSPAS